MPKKIVFMGTPMFAVPILKSLYQNGYPVSCVYTQPPQKSQRGQKIIKNEIYSDNCLINVQKDYFYGYTIICCTNFKIFISKWLSNFSSL